MAESLDSAGDNQNGRSRVDIIHLVCNEKEQNREKIKKHLHVGNQTIPASACQETFYIVMVGMSPMIVDNCGMMRITSRLLLMLCMLSLIACSAKTSRQVSSSLWSEWEGFEQQLQADYPNSVPIILVHGWNGGEFSWPDPRALMAMEQQLQRDIYFFNYRTAVVANRLPPIELLEEQLDSYLKNYDQVDVVAHSMGGLLVRQYLAEHLGDNPIRRVLFLSTPHFGTNIANVLVDIGSIAYTGNIQASELLPGSDFLWQLNSEGGSEFEGKQVLNVYAREQKTLLRGDLVVRASHAWLPWVANFAVDGNHHLGPRITEPWAMAFLASGQLPELADQPAGRELWLRFQTKDADEPTRFNDTSVHRFKTEKTRKEKKFDLCCDRRSGLHPLGGTTLILDDVQPDEVVKLFFRQSSGAHEIHPDRLESRHWPVELHIIDPVDHPEGDHQEGDHQDAIGTP